MVCSLTAMKPVQIPTSVWLDNMVEAQGCRLMGFTVTLMPMLEELTLLAAEVGQRRFAWQVLNSVPGNDEEEEKEEDGKAIPLPILLGEDVCRRASDLELRIQAWQPTCHSHSISVRRWKVCLLQAYSYRSAALLYLYRLLHPAGSSASVDHIALGSACEILAHLSAPPEELRMSTWPTFIAACELPTRADREMATAVFDGVYRVRNTSTTLRTKDFCVRRVWYARDRGTNWDWMSLVQQYPGECIPI